MRIAFFYESIDLGGQQTQTLQLIRRMVDRGHSVSWVHLRGEALRLPVAQFAAEHRIDVTLRPKDYRRAPHRVMQVVWKLCKLFRHEKTDVVISGSGLGSVISGLAARLAGIRHYRLVGCSLRQVEPTLFRHYQSLHVDALIDGYFAWPAVFEELATKRVPTHKFHELNNAVDVSLFRPNPAAGAAVRAKLGIRHDALVIGWIGRISEDMQVGNTLEVCRLLRSRGVRDVCLLLVGGGPWRSALLERAGQYGLSKQTYCTDWIPMEEVPSHVNAMDIVPLLEEDPQGGSILREAMACGRVALSVDGPSGTQRRFMSPESTILISSDNFLARAADAIQGIHRDVDAMKRMGVAARQEAVERMSFDVQVDRILASIT